MANDERTLLFSGSFDPIHPGHLQVVRIGMRELAAARAFLFPHLARPSKRLRPLAVRIAEIELCLRETIGACVAPSDLLQLFHQFGMSRVTAEIRARETSNEPIRIAGSDSALDALARGMLVPQIDSGLRQAVVVRPGFCVHGIDWPRGVQVLKTASDIDVSSTRIRGP